MTEDDARAAGYDDRAELLAEVERHGHADGTLYRIALHLAGPDPRVALRERAEVTDDEWEHHRGATGPPRPRQPARAVDHHDAAR